MSADATRGLIASEQAKLSGAQAEGIRIQKSINMDLEAENRNLRQKIDDKEKEIKKITAERDKYKNLLAKPMDEIAENNANFKETYEAQMELMAEWMVSQKAFKELAIEFGFDRGLTHTEVIEQGNVKKIDVLENKHNEEHGSNASGIPLLARKAPKLKEKLLNNKKASD